MIEIILIYLGIVLNVAGLFYNIGFFYGERRYMRKVREIKQKVDVLTQFSEDSNVEAKG